MRALVWLLLPAFVAGCTRQVARPDVAARHFAVDWDRLDAATLSVDGLTVRAVLLTPAQWPLEGSVKRLLRGDFLGVVDALDLTFHAARIPEGALRDLYREGLVPAYVRVTNPGAAALPFVPERLAVDAPGGDPLPAVQAESLPAQLSELDWERTGLLLVASLLLVVVVMSERNSGGATRLLGDVTELPVRVVIGRADRAGGPEAGAQPPPDRGVLNARVLPAGGAMEGFVFFRHSGRMVDWAAARIIAP
jgi:hypothetical protein